MKKALTLLAVAMVTASSVGCNCCRSLCPCLFARDYCAPAPTYAAVPAYGPSCPPTPVYAAAPTTPVYAAAPQQYTVPQYAAPQYMAPAPQPFYSEAGCGLSYASEMGCGVPYTVADPGCGYMESGYGGMPEQQMQQMMVDPAPAP